MDPLPPERDRAEDDPPGLRTSVSSTLRMLADNRRDALATRSGRGAPPPPPPPLVVEPAEGDGARAVFGWEEEIEEWAGPPLPSYAPSPLPPRKRGRRGTGDADIVTSAAAAAVADAAEGTGGRGEPTAPTCTGSGGSPPFFFFLPLSPGEPVSSGSGA